MVSQKLLEALQLRGWKKITSDAEALQLLRRELKVCRSSQQRSGQLQNMDRLLSIKPGTWYKYARLCRGISILMLQSTH